MTDYNEYLNITVLQENKPVTYKSLARSVGIHVNKAKQALYEFSESQSNIRAVYCITGISLKSNQFSIQLVKDAELDEAKKGYKEISGIHVYSVTSFDPDDFSIFYNACRDAPKLAIEDRIKCGILKNSNVILRDTSSINRPAATEIKSSTISNAKHLTSNATTKSAAPSNPFNSKAKSTASPTLVDNMTKSTTASSKLSSATSTTVKRKGTLNFGPATTKKQAVTSSPKTKEPISKPVAKTSINKMKPKNEHEVRMAKTSIKASDIFSDDEEEEDVEEEDQIDEPQPVEDLDIEEEDVDMDMDQETEEKEIEEEEPSVASLPSPLPGKARRKVLKKKTTKNSRGFLVTEEVWEWETVDEDEIKSITPTSTTTTTKPSITQQNTKKTSSKSVKNAKKPTGQSNLFSFFKKA
ncbi:hypothetical protein INT46_000096 [Mucor plumbeus]|uniref:DNA polymerase delta subunit 3 n=1 Tax=Mucor plumbeus TaxID=97098 RepID=A0A8H7R976_9FUNG|nr:hypothetical protein INT46_000096 [Mucor plumbeus]